MRSSSIDLPVGLNGSSSVSELIKVNRCETRLDSDSWISCPHSSPVAVRKVGGVAAIYGVDSGGWDSFSDLDEVIGSSIRGCAENL